MVILDAKYYCARWHNGSISGQPGTPDIAKQMFYQMVFEKLVNRTNMVNAFLLPEDDKNCGEGKEIKIAETVQLGWEVPKDGRDVIEPPPPFEGINLFTVRIPGICLLERYANSEIANDWLEKIVNEAPHG